MLLKDDKTFLLDKTPFMDFHGSGTWETCSIDGEFVFKSVNGKIIGSAFPFNDNETRKVIFNLYDINREVRFIMKN